MVWAKLDDEILDNPKIAIAGPLGFALHVAAVVWCCRNLTDGHIPLARVRSLLDLSGVMWDQDNPGAGPGPVSAGGRHGADAVAIAEHLADVGLWHRADDGGYDLHDFLDYNPSREKVLAERQRGSARKDKHRMLSVRDPAPASRPPRPRQQRGTPEESALPRVRLASASDGPVPDPVPGREDLNPPAPLGPPPPSGGTTEPVTEVRTRRKPETPCPASDATTEAVEAWAAGWKIPTADPEFVRFLDHHRKSDQRWRDWAAAWRTWQRNAPRFAPRSQVPLRHVQSADGRAWKMPPEMP